VVRVPVVRLSDFAAFVSLNASTVERLPLTARKPLRNLFHVCRVL
jgi:hypothetical protein